MTITVQQAPPGPALLLFPQFVDGGDSGDSAKPNSSRIIIRNNSEQEATLRLLFRNANGTPLQVPVQGQAGPVSEVHRTIEAMGVEEVETAGTGSLKSGIVEVEPLSGDPGKLQGTLVFSLFGTFVSSESSPAQSESLVFVSVDPDTTLGKNTGIAAYNPDPTNSATVRLRLLDANGVEVASRSNAVIGPQQQLLGYVSDDGFFRSYFDSLGAPFLGTLDIVVTNGPDIAVLGLVQKTQALGSALTALSGAGASSASGLFFPQFYEGGDAAGSPQPNSTRIVIRNGSSSAAGRVRLAFRDSSGTPSASRSREWRLLRSIETSRASA